MELKLIILKEVGGWEGSAASSLVWRLKLLTKAESR